MVDKETEIRRKINYVADLIRKSDEALDIGHSIDYYEYYRHYAEVTGYLLRRNDTMESQVPKLIRPNFFTRRLGPIYTIAVLGIAVNPYIALLVLTLLFPIAFPYVVIRAIMVHKTKTRIQVANIFLVGVLNRLREQKLDLISNK